jgi:hypothetical protein
MDGISTNVTVLADPETYEYIQEVGGLCEKISFSANWTAPGENPHSSVTTSVPMREYILGGHTLAVGGWLLMVIYACCSYSSGAAVFVRYEDDRHYPVDKVIGAGRQVPTVAPVSVGSADGT